MARKTFLIPTLIFIILLVLTLSLSGDSDKDTTDDLGQVKEEEPESQEIDNNSSIILERPPFLDN